MKRCSTCNRLEPDEQLKFCRLGGAPLVEDSAVGESFPTRILPASETGDAQIVHTEAGGPAAVTTGLEEERQSKAHASEHTTASRVQPSKSFAARLNQHKTIAFVFVAAVIVAVVSFLYFFRAYNAKSVDSIAVLPFVNESGDPNAEYLSDGITESIINSLSQLPNLGVIARNSAFRYKGKDIDAPAVGHNLNVQSVLTGWVVQRGENLSVSVELIDTTNNHQLWGQQYNRKLADVFALPEEIARDISEKLRLRLTAAEKQQLAKRPTENLKAFQYYMQGRSYASRRTREDLFTSIRYCEKAIEEDQNYALAYACLTDAYANLGIRGYIAPIEGRRKAEEAARKAMTLDYNLAEAHVALGETYSGTFAPYNFQLGDRELRRSAELSPSLAIAHMYLGFSFIRQGRLDEASAEFLKARELDPLSSIIARATAFPYYLKRDYPRTLDLLRQANELGPPFTAPWEIGVYIQNRLFDEALAELEKAKRERKSDPPLDLQHSDGLCDEGEAGRSAQGHQRVGRDVRREPERSTLDCANLCGLKREGNGIFLAGPRLSHRSNRTLL
jgi:TolB-like protein/Tfp pilus assembly protein PilF